MNKYLISMDPYVTGSFTDMVEKENDVELLKYVHNRHMYTLDEDEEGLTKETLIERMEEVNGDGCAYIVSIVNLTTGELIWATPYEV